MRTTIDRAGRVVVPKAMRERLRLLDGGEVELTERDGVVEMTPASAKIELVDGPHGLVAKPAQSLPPLTDEIVRTTLDEARR